MGICAQKEAAVEPFDQPHAVSSKETTGHSADRGVDGKSTNRAMPQNKGRLAMGGHGGMFQRTRTIKLKHKDNKDIGEQLPGSAEDLRPAPVHKSESVLRDSSHLKAGRMGVSNAALPEGCVHLESEATLLVTDMTGFTRLTRKHGIVHYASLIFKMRQLCFPVMKAYGCQFLFTEADDLFVVFPDPVKALQASYHCWDVLRDFNQAIEDPDFQVVIGGLGLACGTGQQVIVDKIHHKLYGPVVDEAFLLGEDTADDEVLISRNMYRRLMADPSPDAKKVLAALRFTVHTGTVAHNTSSEESNSYEMTYYRVDIEDKEAFNALKMPLPADDVAIGEDPLALGLFGAELLEEAQDRESREAFLQLIGERWELFKKGHGAGSPELAEVDGRIRKRFAGTSSDSQDVVVMMYGPDLPLVTSQWGVYQGLAAANVVHDLFRPFYEKHKGKFLDEDRNIVIFQDSESAVACALSCQRAILLHNKRAKKQDRVEVKGFGCHKGHLLVVPGTNVHWGDPVNTSSKLAEDIAVDTPLMLTPPVHDEIKALPAFANITWSSQTVTVSHVELSMSIITAEVALATHTAPSHAAVAVELPVDQKTRDGADVDDAKDLLLPHFPERVYTDSQMRQRTRGTLSPRLPRRARTRVTKGSKDALPDVDALIARSATLGNEKQMDDSPYRARSGGVSRTNTATSVTESEMEVFDAQAPTGLHKSLTETKFKTASHFVGGVMGVGSQKMPETCEHLKTPGTIMVTDMTGFTRLTRKHGIVHYASLIFKMRQLCFPVMKAYGCQFLFTEADDLFVVFPDPVKAVMASFHCWHLITEYNKSVEDEDFKVVIGGIGMATGDGEQIVVDQTRHKIYGPVVDEAFLLGEDTAEDELLITKRLYDKLQEADQGEHKDFLSHLQFTPQQMHVEHNTVEHEEDDAQVFQFIYYSVAFRPPGKDLQESNLQPSLSTPAHESFCKVDSLDMDELSMQQRLDAKLTGLYGADDLHDDERAVEARQTFLSSLKQRWALKPSDKEGLAAVDAKLMEAFMQGSASAVMMYGADIPLVTRNWGVYHGLHMEETIHELFKPFYKKYSGLCLEEDRSIVIFKEAHNAVLCAQECRKAVLNHNINALPKDIMPLKGFGCHSGHLLVVPGTNVHWGDPVNTSSKLAEDYATDAQLIVTEEPMKAERAHAEANGRAPFVWTQKKVTISHVLLPMFILKDGEE